MSKQTYNRPVRLKFSKHGGFGKFWLKKLGDFKLKKETLNSWRTPQKSGPQAISLVAQSASSWKDKLSDFSDLLNSNLDAPWR